MSDSAKCPRCGSELPVNFQAGVCPSCLLQQGLSPSTYGGGSGNDHSRHNSGSRRSWVPPTPAELAPRFPQLEIVELLGQGGMGAVYKVRQRELDRWAALKVLPDEVAHDPNFAERFQREARALALLGHQHIVIVYEFGQRDGVYFLLMEFIDGVTLRQALRASQITAADALSIVTQICDALQFAHEEGVVHRDIKPENILIDKRGRVKIADFGLAKLLGGPTDVPMLTGTHQVMGTPMYMAPEQMEGTRGVDHRADIFSLGVVFYELLTGELPLGRFAPPSQKYQLDVRLDEVVLRTLEKEPNRRYQQASDVKCDVESIRTPPKPQPVASSGVRQTTNLAMKRLLISGGILCGLVAIGVYSTNLLPMIEADRLRREVFALKNQNNSLLTDRHSLNAILNQIRENQSRGNQLNNSPIEPASTQATSGDPNETQAIVQFLEDGPRLNPNFGTDTLPPQHRQIVNEILKKFYASYLSVEALHTKFETSKDHTVLAEIQPFPEEISDLENELWTAIDSQLSLSQQKFLRDSLPLHADPTKPLQLIAVMDAAVGGMDSDGMISGMGGTMMPGMMGARAPMAMMGMSDRSGATYSNNVRYPQLLGWKPNLLPLRISIGRRGKWFRWSIANAKYTEKSGTTGEVRVNFQELDSSEAPELPIGLRRFWKKSELPSPATEEATKAQATPTSEPEATPPNPVAPELRFEEPFLFERSSGD